MEGHLAMSLLSNASTIYLDGTWHPTRTTFRVRNPATGQEVGRAGDADPDLAQLSIDAAARAAQAWAAQPAESRSRFLRAVAQGFREHVDELADILTMENGKPLRESRGELLGAARSLEWAAEEARRVYGRTVPIEAERRGMVWREPIGIVVAVSPWNFPASMLVRKIALALAAGCPIVVKPAEQTPLIAAAMAKIFDDCGCPPGVLAVLTTSRPEPLVLRLLDDPRVSKLSFTGSTEVGLKLFRHAGGRLKSTSLELGGHAPAIVLDDADLDVAIEGVVAAKFRNCGQSCTAINTAYVHAAVAAEFLERVAKRVDALTVGAGIDDTTEVGPLIDEEALAKAQSQVQNAVDKGAVVVTGGQRLEHGQYAAGVFYAPTVLTGITAEMAIAREEIFAPVLPVVTFDNEAEACLLANDTDYGLAAYVFGSDLARVWQTAERLDFGVIGVNDPFPVSPEMPFGGVKNSGIGCEGGSEGIGAFLKTKAITLRL